jgi:hypothetical protein
MASYTGYIAESTNSSGHGYSKDRRDKWYRSNGWGWRWGYNWGGNQDSFLQGWGIRWGEDWGTTITKGWRARQSTGIDIYALPDSGTVTENKPFSLRGLPFTGYVTPTYADDFYNRILMEPVTLDFGSVITEQTLSITVWNAYFVPVRLDNVIENNFDSGMLFSGQTVPSDFTALEERSYDITVNPDGPPSIDASITFDWEPGIDNTTTAIVGSRVLMLPVIFGVGATESLEWKTNILNSWDGTEQRIRARTAPRQRLSVRAYLPRSNMHRIDNLLYRSREQGWVIPLWTEARQGSAVTQNDTVFNVDTRYGDFRVDSLAILWESATKYNVFQISNLTDSTITATSGANDDYDAPWVMPVRSIRLMGNPVRTTSGYDAILEIQALVTDNILLSTSPSSQQFNSEDTWFEEPLAPSADGAPDSYQHRIETIDFETGKFSVFAPWDNIRIGRNVEFIFEGLQAIWEFRNWLHRRSGRLVPFYMPTFENNFKILSTGVIGTAFEAVDWDYDLSLSSRSHIVFRLTDGTWEPRTITDSQVVAGNLQVTISPSLTRDASEIIDVCFFGLKRLNTDVVSMTWLQNNVLRVTLDILEIEP